jgi:hypothetical protein
MYVVVFHKTIVANVTHDLQKDEGFSLRFTPVGGRPMILRDKFSVDTDLACISNLFKNYGVVMGNAMDSFKSQIEYVTEDYDKGGIKNALERFGLI